MISAFPWTNREERGERGMSLRDYMAGQALDGLMHEQTTQGKKPSEIAKAAYMLADAMLEEREKK